MTRAMDQKTFVSPAGWIGIVPALPCLFFGLPTLTLAIWSVAIGHLLTNWPTILFCLAVGIPMTYCAIGFLGYAQVTLLDRAERGGEHWVRFVRPWQREAFSLGAKSAISVWRSKRGSTHAPRSRAMLSTTKRSVKLFEHTSHDRVVEQAKAAGAFLGIPVVDEEAEG